MAFRKIYDSIIEEWLPTKWSRWIAGLTPSIAIGGIFLPNLLQKIDILPTPEQTLLIRLSLPPTILFIGTFIVLLLVVFHCKSLKTTQLKTVGQQSISIPTTLQEISEEKIILTERHEKILNALFQKPSTIESICNVFNMNKEEANYYLFDLYNKHMAHHPAPYSSSQEWHISQSGREYIMSKRIIA